MAGKINPRNFVIRKHHRHDLRDWIRANFPFIEEKSTFNYGPEDFKMLEERADEIYDACRKVEEIDLRAKSSYADYYKEDWDRIRTAYEKRDFVEMAYALKTLVDAIDAE
ncbi:hypothetical protein D6745_00460 [Candidatus Woesearchaeota archaeon]|nr:MAG: hypothetical protein D6745_00460 [Candidatus Woesearchaeota archaeon]